MISLNNLHWAWFMVVYCISTTVPQPSFVQYENVWHVQVLQTNKDVLQENIKNKRESLSQKIIQYLRVEGIRMEDLKS